MKRYVIAAAGLGVLNAAAVLLVLLLVREVEQAQSGVVFGDTNSYGWFSYTPLTSDIEPPGRFPWDVVLPPVVLAALNAGLAVLWLRRSAITPNSGAAPPPAP